MKNCGREHPQRQRLSFQTPYWWKDHTSNMHFGIFYIVPLKCGVGSWVVTCAFIWEYGPMNNIQRLKLHNKIFVTIPFLKRSHMLNISSKHSIDDMSYTKDCFSPKLKLHMMRMQHTMSQFHNGSTSSMHHFILLRDHPLPNNAMRCEK
jgi:hypothetical protein